MTPLCDRVITALQQIRTPLCAAENPRPTRKREPPGAGPSYLLVTTLVCHNLGKLTKHRTTLTTIVGLTPSLLVLKALVEDAHIVLLVCQLQIQISDLNFQIKFVLHSSDVYFMGSLAGFQ